MGPRRSLAIEGLCTQPESVLSGRSGYVTSIDVPDVIGVSAGLTVVVTAAVWLSTGATERWAMAMPIMVVAAALTAAQYLMAGEVTMASELGKGTTVSVVLPTASLAVAEPATPEVRSAA